MVVTSRFWVFTENNYDTIYYDLPHDNVTYMIFQEEVGESGTRHLQGYCELAEAQRLSWLKNHVNNDAHWAMRRGSQEQAIIYCSKEETRVGGPYILGVPSISQQGRRTDLEKALSLVTDGASNWDLMQQYPSVMARYQRFINDYRSTLNQNAVLSRFEPYTPRAGWQTELAALLNGPPDRRKVYVYTDSIGNTGKSWFAERFLPSASMIISSGRFEDIAYTFVQRELTKIVYFDYGRDGMDTFPYRMVEKLKDGCITSTKYECRTVYFEPLHVVIFSNHSIDMNKLSVDRWHFIQDN